MLRKMKFIRLFFCGALLFLTEIAAAQCYRVETDLHIGEPLKSGQQLNKLGVDTTSIDSVYDALQNEILLKSQYAALFLAEHDEQEAIDLIMQKYKEEKKFTRGAFRYLRALNILKYDSIEDMLLSFADTLYQQITEGKATRTEYFVYQDVVRMLIEKNNYSQFSRVQEVVRSRVMEEGNPSYLGLLIDFIKVEKLRQEIIETLVFVLKNNQDISSRHAVVNYSCLFPKSTKLQQTLKETAIEDPSFDVRWWSMVRLKDTYDDTELLDLALSNLKETNEKDEIDRYLSIITGEYNPQSLFLIKDLKDNSPNDLIREEATEIYNDYWWLHFEPYGKAFDYSPSETLDSLKSYTEEVASYDWLGDRGTVRELTNRLDNASRHLARGDSSNTAKQIANYKERLQKVYEQNKQNNSPRFVTEDGYKYLSKNAEYLLTQLPGHSSDKNGGR
jgi:hypothetical protein